MTVRKAFGILFCAVPFAAVAASYPRLVRAKANSAPPYWEGVDASGSVFFGEQCPVVVEKEVLTLNIPQLPKGLLSGDEYAAYDAKATADYTFYNPEDYDITMKLLFPYGKLPTYVGEDVSPKDSHVSVNGAAAECGVRYTYYGNRDFEINGDIERISDERRTDTFYRDTMTVTSYTCEFTLPGEDYAGKLCFIFNFNPQKSRIVFADGAQIAPYVSNGYSKAELLIGGEGGIARSVRFYGIGKPVALKNVLLCDADGKAQQFGAYTLKAGEETTFAQFALKGRAADSAVSETDYYNAFVDMLDSGSGFGGIVTAGDKLAEDALMRWCEYSLEIPAGGRVNNCVTAPLYPAIEGKTLRYEYSYLLSPAQKWADFMAIDIVIETPYCLTHSSLDFTAQSADGVNRYAFSRDGLPQGELTFVLAETEEPGSVYRPFGNKISARKLIIILVMLAASSVVAGAVTMIILFSMAKKKKK